MLFLACHLVQPVFAQTVIGQPDCGRWLTNKNPTDRAWLLGYMSGLSIGMVNKSNPLGSVNSAEQIYLWMDNYCQKNPLNTVTAGGFDLFIEIAIKAK
jgi:hypothetical protein